ncbi:hypothetical protein IWQ60_000890 [Tieghemiomyces parasiticus]|uniref:Uncharacterized protein n=1 Tax=Tieghemiomyces parasiticus TaxID=78921 RepID=A0A9W8E2E0_9FUNG|nr:hypothetical protein IWQ60_000890 [Tieghemiomyces parasiticus]
MDNQPAAEARHLAHHLRRQVLQMVPPTSCNLVRAELLQINPTVRRYPPALAYLHGFLKAYLARVERVGNVGVDEDLLTYYLDLLATEMCYKTYCLGDSAMRSPVSQDIPKAHAPRSITLKEGQLLITQGTAGLRTWEAALRLAEYVLYCTPNAATDPTNPHPLIEHGVLELGSGTGLVGLTCATLATTATARDVVLSDYHPDVLRLLEANVTIHRTCHPASVPVRVVTLDWEQFDQGDASAYSGYTVFGADLVYDPSNVPALVRVVATLTRAKYTVYLASTVRNEMTFGLFLATLSKFSTNLQP